MTATDLAEQIKAALSTEEDCGCDRCVRLKKRDAERVMEIIHAQLVEPLERVRALVEREAGVEVGGWPGMIRRALDGPALESN